LRYVSLALVGVGALVIATAVLFRMPLGEAAVAAPIIVASAGALVGLFAFWIKVAYDSLQRQRHPRRLVAGAAAALALLVVLSFFIELPSRY